MELHRHVLGFLKFYGEDFNTKDNLISVRKGGFLERRDYSAEELLKDGRMNGRGGPQGNKLYIESPLSLLEDVASGAHNYNQVRFHFKLAHQLLLT